MFFIAALALVLARLLWGKDDDSPLIPQFFLPIALVCGWIVFDSIVMPGNSIGRFATFRSLRFLGRISYCTYLVHGSALAVFSGVMIKPVSTALDYYLFKVPVAFVAITATLIIASLSMKLFEGPILKWAHERLHYPGVHDEAAFSSAARNA